MTRPIPTPKEYYQRRYEALRNAATMLVIENSHWRVTEDGQPAITLPPARYGTIASSATNVRLLDYLKRTIEACEDSATCVDVMESHYCHRAVGHDGQHTDGLIVWPANVEDKQLPLPLTTSGD